MDSIKNQDALSIVVYPCKSYYDKNSNIIKYDVSDDFNSEVFRESAILVIPIRMDEDDNEPPAPTTYPLIWSNQKIKHSDYRCCSFCNSELLIIDGYYFCGQFDPRFSKVYAGFHKECIEPIKRHPYHPKHVLHILKYITNVLSISDIFTGFRNEGKRCYCCYRDSFKFYYCSICNFRICHTCVNEQPLLTIEQKKRHEHTLFYIHRKSSMICDVCGLQDRRHFIYICLQCDFVVHKDCVYFPYVIKISRHEHRLSFTPSFLPRKWFCEICRERFDEYYGGYLCSKGCYYVVHSKCVIDDNIWDGKELEGQQEETYEDTMPLKEIYDGVIQHFSHHHYMRLHKEIDKTYKENYYCQACALPLYDGDIFSCMDCNFVLHKVCAYLPLKKVHVMHPHPLVLQENNIKYHYKCSACKRVCNSFHYKCKSYVCNFILDVCCASISEPVDHHCHIHLLFLPSKPGSMGICSICQASIVHHLECGECNFALCFRCATLPKKFMYKHDEHLLIYFFQQDANGEYWCDVCENIINPKHEMYMCNDCGVTVHIKCLLGEDMYMLPSNRERGETINDILLNNHLTRDICKWCHKRCQNKLIYKSFDGAMYCSLSCLYEVESRRY